ncbi:MAG: energy-coupling factor transporter ATPase [Candidatus Edwardsbacteria bacterium]
MKAIDVRHLHFSYTHSKKQALRGLDLSVNPGDSVAIMGESGAGKSTLCLTLNGLIPQFQKGDFSGSVFIFGELSTKKKVYEWATTIGLLFQDFESQLFSTNVELEVTFSLSNLGVPFEQAKQKTKEALFLVGLAEFENRDPATLSGGEKQRLAIASILAVSPSILVLDEPTSDLDPLGKEEIFKITQTLKNNLTLLIVDHETEEVLNCAKVVIMHQGKFIREGSPAEIFYHASLLKEFGIRPLDRIELFSRLGITERPATDEETVEILIKNNFSISSSNLREIVKKDEKSYGEPIIEVRNVSYAYDGISALENVSLTIRQGEFVAIVGQNGSGKTTLVKHFNGLLKPKEGKVSIKGKDTKKERLVELARIVGYVFQNPDHQIFAETVKEEVSFAPRNFGLTEEEIRQRVAESLRAVHLEGYENEDPFSLTKGERQRVAVASVLSARPECLIFDEPTTGLDYKQTKDMMDLIKKLNDSGFTIIIVTHTMWVVSAYAHRMILMKQGRILADGKTREIFRQRELLQETSLKPPGVVNLSSQLGYTLLSLEEMTSVLKKSS